CRRDYEAPAWQPAPRRKPAGLKVDGDHCRAHGAHQLGQCRALGRRPYASSPTASPPRICKLVEERYRRHTRLPQRRQRGVSEQRNTAVRVIEDGVLKKSYIWAELLELDAQSLRPVADLG